MSISQRPISNTICELTAVGALHRVWQSCTLSWIQRDGHPPSRPGAVTLRVLKVVVRL